MTSLAELTLEAQLDIARIPYEREFRFDPERRWRADAAIWCYEGARLTRYRPDLLVEIDGGGFVAGRHSRGVGMEKDAEKASAAAIHGYRVIRCTPRQVKDGTCLRWIIEATERKAA